MFLKNLESLRGVAALMVALSHSLLVLSVDGQDNIWFARFGEIDGAQALMTRALLLPFNGGAAVVLFFVLSGYVLGLSLDRHRFTFRNTLGFYLKRLFRLYPAHLAVLAGIVAVLYTVYEPRQFEAASAWFAQWYGSTPNAEQLARNAMLNRVDLNHIAWSLQVELAGSLFLPLFYPLARRLPLTLNAAAFVTLVWLSWHTNNLFLIFLYCFYGGLILPQVQQQTGTLLEGRTGRVLLSLGLATWCFGYTLAGPDSLFGRVLIETMGSMCVIAWLIDKRNTDAWFNRLLARDLVNRLGRYSYSFYLLHFVILYALAYGMLSVVPADALQALPLLFGLVLMCLSVPLTYWLAGISHRCVEMPMVRLGKRLVGEHG